jgi:hypothetical protein
MCAAVPRDDRPDEAAITWTRFTESKFFGARGNPKWERPTVRFGHPDDHGAVGSPGRNACAKGNEHHGDPCHGRDEEEDRKSVV